MSKTRKGRELDGLLILDKPLGLSSNQCLQRVKRLLGAAKAGHTGSLDPLASGVLPLCFGEATKVSQFLLDADKGYHARVRLGVTTTTGDAGGDTTATHPVPPLTREQLERVLREFTGTLTQSPSVYSALKQDGVPLYKLARAGKPITPKFRDVHITRLELLSPTLRRPGEGRGPAPYPEQHAADVFDRASLPFPIEFDIAVDCSKGTYIRTLAEDIGKRLGCGAHLSALRRTKAGPFLLEQSLGLDTMAALAERGELEPHLLPPDQAIADLPALALDSSAALRLCQGQVVQTQDPRIAPAVRVYAAPNQRFLGIAALQPGGTLVASRLLKQ